MPLKPQGNTKAENPDLQSVITDAINNTSLKKKNIPPPNKEGDGDYAFSIKFPKSHKEILEAHYKAVGLTFSNGIRMLIYKYMQENNIWNESENK